MTPIRDILLTGATGFLGIHILKDFLEHYPGKVYCLMRSKDGKSGDARLKVRLVYYFEKDYQELFGKRILTIEGDMNQLVTSNVKVDTVINCAAIVKHFAAGDELEKYTVFHPYNNHAIYLSDIIYVMKEYGFNIDIVSDGEFAECLRKKMQDDKMISALTGILAYEANDTGKPIYVLGRSNQFTTEVLYRLQFKWPMTSEVYIKKAIEALAGLGFFDE